MLSIKVLLISTSILSMAVMLKLSMPEFAFSDLPSILNFLNSCLRPPYLYLIINSIIITIVASSRLQSNKVEYDHPLTAPVVKLIPMDYAAAVYDGVVPMVEVKTPEIEMYVTEGDIRVPETIELVNAMEEMKSVNETVFSKPVPKNGLTIPRPVSSRFGHRKSIKASPQGGKTLGVTKPKKQDTLESTWKTITEGRQMPLTRHLKKSDTCETHGRHYTPTTSPMTKSETFNVSNPPPPSSLSRSTGSGKLKKDPSLGQEELNKRVEAFIKKFNDDMRLQRQESLNHYMETINRGAP